MDGPTPDIRRMVAEVGGAAGSDQAEQELEETLDGIRRDLAADVGGGRRDLGGILMRAQPAWTTSIGPLR